MIRINIGINCTIRNKSTIQFSIKTSILFFISLKKVLHDFSAARGAEFSFFKHNTTKLEWKWNLGAKFHFLNDKSALTLANNDFGASFPSPDLDFLL